MSSRSGITVRTGSAIIISPAVTGAVTATTGAVIAMTGVDHNIPTVTIGAGITTTGDTIGMAVLTWAAAGEATSNPSCKAVLRSRLFHAGSGDYLPAFRVSYPTRTFSASVSNLSLQVLASRSAGCFGEAITALSQPRTVLSASSADFPSPFRMVSLLSMAE